MCGRYTLASVDPWDLRARFPAAAGLDIRPVLTHTLPLDEFEKGFELIHHGQCGKVVLVP